MQPSVRLLAVAFHQLRLWVLAALCITHLAATGAAAHAQNAQFPSVFVSGGIFRSDNRQVALQFSWSVPINITGQSWNAGQTVFIHIVGPLNSLGVTPTDRLLGKVVADTNGNFSRSFTLPFTFDFANDVPTNVPRPGNYSVYAIHPASSPFVPPTVADAVDHINICPMDIPPFAFQNFLGIDWENARGGRKGQLADHSPELVDPTWLSVWSEQPVAIYATVASTDARGNNQPAFISHAEYPGNHFAHDLNLELVPDPDYSWVLGVDNFIGDQTLAATSRLEWEWETQNNGSPFSYGRGNIGVPLFVTPTAGDRVYTVGRWVMDHGEGDKTEIHPARMLATMRKRNTAVTFAPFSILTRASQVDIFVSGHGGGANEFPDALNQLLNEAGEGGGQIYDILQGQPLNTYEAFGPADSFLAGKLTDLLGGDSSLIQAVAGPSGLGWPNGPEFRPVNDMDYDFDVPLPPPPVGAKKVRVLTLTQPGHTTLVKEVITFTNPDSNGLPKNAHIHLPYKNADFGVYARTLKFYWDKFSPPGNHYRVSFNNLTFFLPNLPTIGDRYFSGRTNMWADVCGQWKFLTALNPDAFLNAAVAQVCRLNNQANFDVFLDPADTLRVYTQGYDQEPFDSLFGRDVTKTAYDGALDLALTAANAKVNTFNASEGENVDLGGALFESTTTPKSATGEYITDSFPFYFFQDFNVTYVPRPPAIRVTGLPAAFGRVCLGSSKTIDVLLANTGETPLNVTSIAITGGGYSDVPGLPVPFVIQPGQVIDLGVTFKPTDITQGRGTITIQCNDPLQLTKTYGLSGSVGHATISATANTSRTPTIAVGAVTTWPVTIANTGTCTLFVRPSITGDGFSIVLPSSYYDPITGRLFKDIVVAPGKVNTDLVVKFVCPSVQSIFVGTLSLASNDPVAPTTTLTFGAEGVPVGVRVLVVGADGVPLPVVDRIGIRKIGVKGDTAWKDVPLTTIDPPAAWKRIQYHLTTALEPGDYKVRVRVGETIKTVDFSVAPYELTQITVTVP